MSGRDEAKLGLALGGGAVLGYAHVGVLGVLEAYGVRPDVVAGTSAGAFVGALYAFGLSPAEIIRKVEPLNWRAVSGVSLTSLGLANNEGLGELVDEAIGEDARIEDARIPLGIVAADVRNGKRVVLRDGPVAEAVRASAAIPGIFVPVERNDQLLVDGGIVENVPVRVAREMGADRVIASALTGVVDFKPPKTLMGVLANAFTIVVDGAAALELESADVVIKPDLSGFNHWNVENREAIIDAGRKAAESAVPAIREILDQDLEEPDGGRSILRRLLGD